MFFILIIIWIIIGCYKEMTGKNGFLTELSAKGSTPCKWCKFHGRSNY